MELDALVLLLILRMLNYEGQLYHPKYGPDGIVLKDKLVAPDPNAPGAAPSITSTGRRNSEVEIREMAYVGIFIVDRYFASLCNRSDIRLSDDYGTMIRSLGERDIDEFIAELGKLCAQCPHAGLSRRIQQSIEQGGYIQERTKAL